MVLAIIKTKNLFLKMLKHIPSKTWIVELVETHQFLRKVDDASLSGRILQREGDSRLIARHRRWKGRSDEVHSSGLQSFLSYFSWYLIAMVSLVNTLPLCEHYPVHLGGNSGASNFYNLDFHADSDLLVAIGDTADTAIKGKNSISGIVGMISAY